MTDLVYWQDIYVHQPDDPYPLKCHVMDCGRPTLLYQEHCELHKPAQRPRALTCQRGHLRTPENIVIITVNGREKVQCTACQAMTYAERRARWEAKRPACKIPGCEKRASSGWGMCAAHYQARRRAAATV